MLSHASRTVAPAPPLVAILSRRRDVEEGNERGKRENESQGSAVSRHMTMASARPAPARPAPKRNAPPLPPAKPAPAPPSKPATSSSTVPPPPPGPPPKLGGGGGASVGYTIVFQDTSSVLYIFNIGIHNNKIHLFNAGSCYNDTSKKLSQQLVLKFDSELKSILLNRNSMLIKNVSEYSDTILDYSFELKKLAKDKFSDLSSILIGKDSSNKLRFYLCYLTEDKKIKSLLRPENGIVYTGVILPDIKEMLLINGVYIPPYVGKKIVNTMPAHPKPDFYEEIEEASYVNTITNSDNNSREDEIEKEKSKRFSIFGSRK
jgi:hypothetical protein